MDSGAVLCWGGGWAIGPPTSLWMDTDNVRTLPLTSAATALSCAETHCCAVASGEVYCWGRNDHGQLSGLGPSSELPRHVPSLTGITNVATSSESSCALADNGAVTCWGGPYAALATISGLMNPTTIEGGGGHFCAVHDGGRVACWGENEFGQLGIGVMSEDHNTARNVGSFADATGLGLGAQHTCAIHIGGTVDCWGDNAHGQLGNGSMTASFTPIAVPSIAGAQKAALGERHTCLQTASNELRCFGSDAEGQINNHGVTNPWPTSDPGFSNVALVAAGAEFTLTINDSGIPWACGNNRERVFLSPIRRRGRIQGTWRE